ncbi:MAG: hypothetical protein JWM74_3480, partial [Myxococcaceae bacterium]|nr:hypothetical protein [Myxococcaceae bacterium]
PFSIEAWVVVVDVDVVVDGDGDGDGDGDVLKHGASASELREHGNETTE